jgi:hypothetical protein
MRTDGQADMTKLTVAFRNFAKAPKNGRLGPWKTERQWQPWYINSSFLCYARIFTGPVHIVLATDSAIKFQSGFMIPDIEIRKELTSLINV